MQLGIILRGYSFRVGGRYNQDVASSPDMQMMSLKRLRSLYPTEDLYMCTGHTKFDTLLLHFRPRNLSTSCIGKTQAETFERAIALLNRRYEYILAMRFDLFLKKRIPVMTENLQFAFAWRERFPDYMRRNRKEDHWWNTERRVGDMVHMWKGSITPLWSRALCDKRIVPDGTHMHEAFKVATLHIKHVGFLLDGYYSSASECISPNPLYFVIPRDMECTNLRSEIQPGQQVF